MFAFTVPTMWLFYFNKPDKLSIFLSSLLWSWKILQIEMTCRQALKRRYEYIPRRGSQSFSHHFFPDSCTENFSLSWWPWSFELSESNTPNVLVIYHEWNKKKGDSAAARFSEGWKSAKQIQNITFTPNVKLTIKRIEILRWTVCSRLFFYRITMLLNHPVFVIQTIHTVTGSDITLHHIWKVNFQSSAIWMFHILPWSQLVTHCCPLQPWCKILLQRTWQNVTAFRLSVWSCTLTQPSGHKCARSAATNGKKICVAFSSLARIHLWLVSYYGNNRAVLCDF